MVREIVLKVPEKSKMMRTKNIINKANYFFLDILGLS